MRFAERDARAGRAGGRGGGAGGTRVRTRVESFGGARAMCSSEGRGIGRLLTL